MTNRITVSIGGQNYTLVSDEEESKVQTIASFVNQELAKVSQGSTLSLADAAILTALNITDSYFKERGAADNLRGQLKEYLDEASRLKNELSEARREIFRLQHGKEKNKE